MCSKKVLVMSLLLILVLGACGGGSSGGNPVTPTPAPTQPTAPPSIPAANIIAFGQGQLLSCFSHSVTFKERHEILGLAAPIPFVAPPNFSTVHNRLAPRFRGHWKARESFG